MSNLFLLEVQLGPMQTKCSFLCLLQQATSPDVKQEIGALKKVVANDVKLIS